MAKAMIERIEQANKAGDSVGGIVEVIVKGFAAASMKGSQYSGPYVTKGGRVQT